MSPLRVRVWEASLLGNEASSALCNDTDEREDLEVSP